MELFREERGTWAHLLAVVAAQGASISLFCAGRWCLVGLPLSVAAAAFATSTGGGELALVAAAVGALASTAARLATVPGRSASAVVLALAVGLGLLPTLLLHRGGPA